MAKWVILALAVSPLTPKWSHPISARNDTGPVPVGRYSSPVIRSSPVFNPVPKSPAGITKPIAHSIAN